MTTTGRGDFFRLGSVLGDRNWGGGSGVAARWARRLFAAVAAALALPAVSAERDICENKAGAELIRCIEAAARSGP